MADLASIVTRRILQGSNEYSPEGILASYLLDIMRREAEIGSPLSPIASAISAWVLGRYLRGLATQEALKDAQRSVVFDKINSILKDKKLSKEKKLDALADIYADVAQTFGIDDDFTESINQYIKDQASRLGLTKRPTQTEKQTLGALKAGGFFQQGIGYTFESPEEAYRFALSKLGELTPEAQRILGEKYGFVGEVAGHPVFTSNVYSPPLEEIIPKTKKKKKETPSLLGEILKRTLIPSTPPALPPQTEEGLKEIGDIIASGYMGIPLKKEKKKKKEMTAEDILRKYGVIE